jgi:hypothetical protein
LQWFQDQRQIRRDNLNIVRREASGDFRNKKREYLKDKINERATNSRNKYNKNLYKGINELRGVTNLELI